MFIVTEYAALTKHDNTVTLGWQDSTGESKDVCQLLTKLCIH